MNNKVLFSARTDLSSDFQYSDGKLILTEKEIQFTQEEKNIKRTYLIQEIKSLEVELVLSGGILIARKEEEDIKVTAFTNAVMKEVQNFIKAFKQYKSDGKIDERLYEKDKNEDFCPKCGARYPSPDRKVCPKCMNKSSVFFRTLHYFKPYKLQIAIMFLCYILTAVLNLIMPYIGGTILYDKVLKKNSAFLEMMNFPAGEYVLLLLFVVLFMALAKLTIQLLGIVHGVLTAKMVPDVVKELKVEVFKNLGELSVGFYNKKQTGGLMTRVIDDSEQVTGFYFDGVPYFIINVLSMAAMIIIMFLLNVKLTICCLVLLPFLFLASFKMLPRLWNRYGKRHRASRSMYSQINDNITGARVVKAFGKEKNELTRFEKYNNRVKRSELALVAYDTRYKALYTTVENISNFLVWGVGSVILLHTAGMELGMLITFVGYVTQLKDPLDFMANIFRMWTESMNAASRIYEIIDSTPEIQEKRNPIQFEKINGEIELSHVTFGYEQHKPVLKDVSFHVKAGKMLGIVGRSGAGKSTLVNLISRLYDVKEGQVRIDGVDVKDLSFKSLHNNIAMVSQETYIFMGTVAQNIAYAKEDATREEIVRAAKFASAHDFICKMPDGYDTMIGSSGRSLSGGERQRISIARAILADPKILILDEATAAVDTETEAAIQKSLDTLTQGRTTLSIAHRLSTLRNADSLIILDDGKVTESGTHQELIEKKGTYFKLMELQTKSLALRGIE